MLMATVAGYSGINKVSALDLSLMISNKSTNTYLPKQPTLTPEPTPAVTSNRWLRWLLTIGLLLLLLAAIFGDALTAVVAFSWRNASKPL